MSLLEWPFAFVLPTKELGHVHSTSSSLRSSSRPRAVANFRSDTDVPRPERRDNALMKTSAQTNNRVAWLAFGVAAIATVVAPFVLTRRMRALDGWRDLAGRARAFGFVTIAVLLAAMASADTSVQGLTQRVAATLVPLGVVALAWRVRRVATVPGVGFEPTRPLRDRGF